MILTTSNILAGLTPTVTSGISTDLPQNMTKQDFSFLYASANSQVIVFEFGAISIIDYVGLVSSNLNKAGSFVRVYDGTQLIATIFTDTNRPIVVSFAAQSFTNLKIEVNNGVGGSGPIINYVAAGSSLEVPNGGEQAGYSRAYLMRSYNVDTTVNNLTAPISQTRSKKQIRSTLTIPNATKFFSENEYQIFLDFTLSNLFFVAEQDADIIDEFSGTNISCYLCFDLTNDKPKAHGQTRALNSIAFSYKVFNGL